MQAQDKASTSTNLTNASNTDDVADFVRRRKEDALALAQLAYDMFVEQEMADADAEGQDDEQSSDN